MRKTFINEAILSAEKSTLKSANHGAIVVYRGKIVGRGYNKYCVENVNKVNRWSVHAEVDAINNALRKISHEDLRKSTLIVVRKMKNLDENENCRECISKNNTETLTIKKPGKNEKNGDWYNYKENYKGKLPKMSSSQNLVCEEIGLSAPCKHCANYIKRNGIKTCYFS